MFTDRDMLKVVTRTAKKLGREPEEILDVAVEVVRQCEADDLDQNRYFPRRPA